MADESSKSKGAEKYSAHASLNTDEGQLLRLQIYRALAPARAPRYSDLDDITFDGPFGLNMVLHFRFMAVAIRGKNLQKVVEDLQEHRVKFICEYHPDLWAKPDDDSPIITMIKVVMKEPQITFEDQPSQSPSKGEPGKKHLQ